MPDTQGEAGPLRLPALVVLMGALVGLYWALPALISSRPAISSKSVDGLNREDVDARLWQDPLSSMYAHWKPLVDAKDDDKVAFEHRNAHSIESFSEYLHKLAEQESLQRRQSLRPLTKQKYLVLGVMLPSAPYADDTERRLRTREAVLEALIIGNYVPQDGEHIGFFVTGWPLDDLSWQAAHKEVNTKEAQAGTSQSEVGRRPGHELAVPYEWFRAKLNETAGATTVPAESDVAQIPSLSANEYYDKVLVLWLREDAFDDHPLRRLGKLLAQIKPGDEPSEVRIIGPWSSENLRTIAAEAAASLDEQTSADLKQTRIYAAAPTVSEEFLLYALHWSTRWDQNKPRSVQQLLDGELKNDAGPPRFVRSITPDNKVVSEMVEELKRRGIDVTNHGTHVVIISELDTFYARTLLYTFLAQAAGCSVEELLEGRKAFPDWIRTASYFRGIDGQIPEDGAVKEHAESSHPKSLKPYEAPEGLNQSDYLRRLSDELAQYNSDLINQGKGGVAAVGVLGSDLYDKLLVLRSLRHDLPDAVFFTKDLYARLGHPDEWNAAHNLVVVSSYGLTMHPIFQQHAPPFRDSYQTSTFAATLQALGKKVPPVSDTPPRVFEIGRSGPHDLSVDATGEKTARMQTLDKLLPRTKAKDEREFVPTPHPARPDLSGWWTIPHFIYVVVAVIIAIALALLERQLSAGDSWSLHGMKTEVLESTWLFVGMALVIVGPIIWFCYLSQDMDGEPLEFLDGISIWPSEAIRLMAGLLGFHFIYRANRELRQNNEDIAAEFCLVKRSIPSPVFSLSKIRQFLNTTWQSASFLGWDVKEGEDRVNAQTLWTEYLHRGEMRVRLVRILPMAVGFLALGFLLMDIFGTPSVPYRGWRSLWVDHFVLSIAVSMLIFVTFYVVDATRLNRQFIRYLASGDTVWPQRTLERCRDIRGLPIEDLPEYLDIMLIATRTQTVGKLIYYPFFLITLMLIARLSYFDNWTWPIGLVTVLSLVAAYALYCGVTLRNEAEAARGRALLKLRDRYLRYAAKAGTGIATSFILELIKEVESEKRGAFSPFTEHPVLRALLVPSGSLGAVAILQMLLPRL